MLQKLDPLGRNFAYESFVLIRVTLNSYMQFIQQPFIHQFINMKILIIKFNNHIQEFFLNIGPSEKDFWNIRPPEKEFCEFLTHTEGKCCQNPDPEGRKFGENGPRDGGAYPYPRSMKGCPRAFIICCMLYMHKHLSLEIVNLDTANATRLWLWYILKQNQLSIWLEIYFPSVG